eukprot:gene2189-2389_t
MGEMDASHHSLLLSERSFLLVLAIVIVLLYANSLDGNFVWDDRAAIVRNEDIRSHSSIFSLFLHDFWGQDIRLRLSHKSYRPLTVLTFKMDHFFYGLNAFGYHCTNVLLYVLSCWSMFWLCKTWLSPSCARFTSLIFTFHPVHVEGVASLVGRADCLCSIFYFAAVALQTMSCRERGYKSAVLFGLSLTSVAAASFAKEIGITVCAVMIVVEVLEASKLLIASHPLFRLAKVDRQSDVAYGYLTSYSLLTTIQIIFSTLRSIIFNMASIARLLILTSVTVVFFMFRSWLHGEHALYPWTILENHVHGLPDFQSRMLSIAQMHFWYFMKLFYPKYLCFDYGYACIATVHHWMDARNLLPLVCYLLLMWLVYNALLKLRLSKLLGLSLLFIPLSPALNIAIPVGTLLAERLLFVPSVGFSMLVGEILVEDCQGFWQHVNRFLESLFHSEERKRPKLFLLRTLLLPILLACSWRVITRNRNWLNERDMYSSALEVCPHSVKALGNFAVIATQPGDDLQKAKHAALEAIELFPLHQAAAMNAALVATKLKEDGLSIALLEYSLALSGDNVKTLSYLSSALLSWSNRKDIPQDIVKGLRAESARRIRAAADSGQPTPSTLFLAGSAALDSGDPSGALRYYHAALTLSQNLQKMFRERSKHVVVEDDIRAAYAYNQMGQAARKLGRFEDALAYYKQGLELEPQNEPLLTNLAALYIEMGHFQEALIVFESGVALLDSSASVALLNNYGNLLLNMQNYTSALFYFNRALQRVNDDKSSDNVLILNADGGGSVEDTVRNNIEKTKNLLQTHPQ